MKFLLTSAGMSAMDAIVAATGNAARALGWDSSIGTLERSKVADLIVLDANPLDDLRVLADKKYLQCVMKDGRVAACRAGLDLPPGVLAKNYLSVG